MQEQSQGRSHKSNLFASKSQQAQVLLQNTAFEIKQKALSSIDVSMMPVLEYRNCVYSGNVDKRNQPHGLGILIYDNGQIIISRFRRAQIEGYFLYFANLNINSKSNDNLNNWLWLYGTLDNQKLEGKVYVFDRFHRAVQGQYQKGKLKLHQKKTRKITDQTVSSAITPSRFLLQNLSENESQCANMLQTKQTYLSVFYLGDNKKYYGTVHNQKPHGYGLIFTNQKLLCLGWFTNGRLNGHGRVYLSENIILDGIFGNNLMKEGWVIDMKNNQTYFGVSDGNIFEYKQQYNGLQLQRIIKYRRRFHLQSLNFTNTHFTQSFAQLKNNFLPLVQLLPIQKNYPQVVEDSIIPLFISQISRVNARSVQHQQKGIAQSTAYLRLSGKTKQQQRELIELIRQYQAERTNYENVSNALRSKSKQAKQKRKLSGSHSTIVRKTQKSKQKVLGQRSRSKSPNINSGNHSKSNANIRSSNKNTSEIAKANNSSINTGRQTKINGRISQINKFGGSQDYSMEVPRSTKWTHSSKQNKSNWSKNSQNRVNLHDIYSKYLKKEPI